MDFFLEFSKVPHDSREAAKYIIDLLLNQIFPRLQNIRSKFPSLKQESDLLRIRDVYMLTGSQIRKSTKNFIDILRNEIKNNIYLLESRQFSFERILWCISKIGKIEEFVDKLIVYNSNKQYIPHDSIFDTPMYFVNWIDYAFEVLGKLSTIIYRTDYKENDQLYRQWKDDVVELVSSLHMSMDELILTAITLQKYCLEEDQPALKARCQVVLREMKTLFNELIQDDITGTVKITPEHLKLPIKPSNVNILIDVLKDVLYILETNINSAVLAVLIHCYVNCSSPIDVMIHHFSSSKTRRCPCTSECTFVKDFDLYNERLAQIGAFAMSCSSDQKRVLTVRSGLTSLEALESHLVPAVSSCPNSTHAKHLAEIWQQEVREIRDAIFLIIDPAAFVRKCKLFMQEIIMEMKEQECYDNRNLYIVINTAALLHDFFAVYKKYEPDAVMWEQLRMLLFCLKRAEKECKAVSNLFTKNNSFLTNMDVYKTHSFHEPDFSAYVERVKLLYSKVRELNNKMDPKDDAMFSSDKFTFFEDEQEIKLKNATHTIINPIDADSRKERKLNLTRSIFARTANVRTPSRRVFSKLTENLKVKKSARGELSFALEVSELFKIEPYKPKPPINTRGMTVQEKSFSKVSQHHWRSYPFMHKTPKTFPLDGGPVENEKDTQNETEVFDESMSLQISAVLDQIGNITNPFGTSTSKLRSVASTSSTTTGSNPSTEDSLEHFKYIALLDSQLSGCDITTIFESIL